MPGSSGFNSSSTNPFQDDDSVSTAGSVRAEDEEKKEKVKNAFKLDDITVTATRTEREAFDTPRAITIVNKKEVARENQLSIVDSLNDKPGIWVEKRTTSSSDPVIRGFAGGNLLALVDGNSLTSLWGEGGYAGDDMYGKVDAESIERIEVIRGPTSVLYGSNALGGVINFITKSSPIDYTESGFRAGGLTKGSYGSAAEEYRIRQEIYGACPRFKFFLGGTSHKIHDVEAGGGVGTQDPTGGRDYSWDFKGQYKLTDNQEIELAIQDMHRHKVRRYYKPDQTNFNDREAATLTWKGTELSDWLSELKVWGYFQNKRDKRIDHGNAKTGYAETDTYSMDIQAHSPVRGNHRLTYGMHYHEDHGVCPDDEQFKWHHWGGATEKVAPDSNWSNFGIYLQDEWDVIPCLTLIASGRYDRFHFNSDVDKQYAAYVKNNLPATHDPYIDDFSDSKGVFSGGLGLLYRLTDNVNLITNYAHGFRQFGPKFGLTHHHGFGWLAPHPFLDPVECDTFEVGTKALYERFAASLIGYYSSIRNWQTNVPGNWNGMSHEPTTGEPIYVTTSGNANVYGVELETETMLSLIHSVIPDTWSVSAGFAWNYGNDRANDEPLRHTQPARAIVALKWNDEDVKRNGWFELSADMVRRYDRIPSGRIDPADPDKGYLKDPQDKNSGLLRDYGLPGYTVYTARGGFDIMKDLSLSVAVENFTDKKYRRAHSRWDEAGLNFLVSLTYRFGAKS